ncbi:hypothetical protein AXK11_04685 [Cephaloticoccus primus]|uniref:Peptidase S55 domain-containing protein n=1 Tax=Cephaloticoccus primus TaxID=1548207 RepID=A0A139SN01_9BACT|nr:SpoIVB peptidase S55 domain-containing protein [Cephaloticoccus primus]KXU35983.1 hypothetical protein AXK11_04685 [Cephaloticoccus primus]
MRSLLLPVFLAALSSLPQLAAQTPPAPPTVAPTEPPLPPRLSAVQPANPEFLPLAELRPGMRGEVWTVFRGTEPEPFEVEVTGVIHDALGPGKSLILCLLTDARVQHMGAVAGMSGSPLYIEGRLAGALSYQVQKFETVRYAGFTPIEDLLEVGEKSRQLAAAQTEESARRNGGPTLATTTAARKSAPATAPTADVLRPLSPVFAVGGLSPQVVDWLRPQFAELGLRVSSLGGRSGRGGLDATAAGGAPDKDRLRPGDAVAVALTTGDISLAGTGTVSYVEGDRLIAFGHPMMSLGEVALPMARAEIVTILPSSENSVKIANTGELIGTINQDRLSAIAGFFGKTPPMIPVEVAIEPTAPSRHGEANAVPAAPTGSGAHGTATAAARTLHFSVVPHPQLMPLAVGVGAAQATLGSNDAGLNEGARLIAEFSFPGEAPVRFETLLAGAQGALQGISDLARGIGSLMQNPYERVFPTEVKLRLRPLAENPLTTIESVQLSRSELAPGEPLTLTIQWRNFQGAVSRTRIPIPISPEWLGKSLEVIVARGDLLDQVTGRQFINNNTQLRSFSAYLDFVRQARSNTGLSIAVVERAGLFLDQAQATRELPASLARIAQRSDSARYQSRRTGTVLWETQSLPDRLVTTAHRLSFRVVD